MITEPLNLDTAPDGTWSVNTATGSTYRLEKAGETITQTRLHPTHPLADDEDQIRLKHILPIQVGAPLVMELDRPGARYRTTSLVTSIHAA